MVKKYEIWLREIWNIMQKNIKYCADFLKKYGPERIKYDAKILNMVQKYQIWLRKIWNIMRKNIKMWCRINIEYGEELNE